MSPRCCTFESLQRQVFHQRHLVNSAVEWAHQLFTRWKIHGKRETTGHHSRTPKQENEFTNILLARHRLPLGVRERTDLVFFVCHLGSTRTASEPLLGNLKSWNYSLLFLLGCYELWILSVLPCLPNLPTPSNLFIFLCAGYRLFALLLETPSNRWHTTKLFIFV